MATSLAQVELQLDGELSPEATQRIKKLADTIVDDITKLYSMGDELGRGRFSIVQHSVHLKEQVPYAAKVVENKSLGDEENLEALETEIDILRKLEHPNIVGVKEVVVDRENTYIIMELLSGGELFNRIVDRGPFPEADAAKLFAQILLSMEYLHSLNIVHRDVKPENILYTAEGSNSVKLIDFGYAGLWSAEKPLTGLCGTPDYVAPEVLTWYEEDVDGTPYGKSSDLWSLGVLLYVILSGCSPFSADEEDEILKLVASAQYVFHEGEFGAVSASAKDMIAKLLVADPMKRLTMPQMLAHPWLADAVKASRAEIAAATAAKSKEKANGGAKQPKAAPKPAAAPAAPPAPKQQQAAPATRTAAGGGAEAPSGGAESSLQSAVGAPAAPPPTIEPRVEPVSGGKGMSCCTIS